MNEGLQLGLELMLDSNDGKVMSAVRGWRNSAYILAEAPNVNWCIKSKYDGMNIGRYSNNGKSYGFSIETLGAFPELGLLVVRYPTDAVISGYRANERYSFSMNVILRDPESKGTAKGTGMIMDMSSGGVKFISDIELGQNVSLLLSNYYCRTVKNEWMDYKIVRVEKVGNYYIYGASMNPHGGNQKSIWIDLIDAFRPYYEPHKLLVDSDRIDDMDPVGCPCHVHIGKLEMLSTIRGFKQDRYAIIDVPTINNQPAIIVGGKEEVIVRLHNKGKVYGFTANVLKQYTTPFPVWTLGLSSKMESHGLRQAKRIATFTEADLLIPGDVIGGAVLDASEGGIKFATRSGVPDNVKYCKIWLSLFGDSSREALNCKIQNLYKSMGHTLVGISILEEDSVANRVFRSFYKSLSRWSIF